MAITTTEVRAVPTTIACEARTPPLGQDAVQHRPEDRVGQDEQHDEQGAADGQRWPPIGEKLTVRLSAYDAS